MKAVIRYQSKLLPRRSYKPSRVIRIRPAKVRFVFRPVRFGIEPKITNQSNQNLERRYQGAPLEPISVL